MLRVAIAFLITSGVCFGQTFSSMHGDTEVFQDGSRIQKNGNDYMLFDRFGKLSAIRTDFGNTSMYTDANPQAGNPFMFQQWPQQMNPQQLLFLRQQQQLNLQRQLAKQKAVKPVQKKPLPSKSKLAPKSKLPPTNVRYPSYR